MQLFLDFLEHYISGIGMALYIDVMTNGIII